LQDALNQFINGRKWTDATFATNEKIEGTMLITINSVKENTYGADIQITASRPAYNSSYMSPLCNIMDNEFEFDYITGQNLDFSENNIDNNLTATIAFYAYIILGLDFDSFALSGGKAFFERAMSIATSAQSLPSNKGWATFGGDRNRYALALSLTDDSSASVFHTMWYNYHRKGLDEMAANPTRGRTEIENTVPDLQKIYQSRPYSPLLFFYGDTKLYELVSVYTKASAEERQTAYNLLRSIYPTKDNIVGQLKN
jgi:hypothetical protein